MLALLLLLLAATLINTARVGQREKEIQRERERGKERQEGRGRAPTFTAGPSYFFPIYLVCSTDSIIKYRSNLMYSQAARPKDSPSVRECHIEFI